MADKDKLSEIREGVRVALQLSYEKLLRAGYTPSSAKAILRGAATDAVNSLD